MPGMSTPSAAPGTFVLVLGGANMDIVASAPTLHAAESNPGRIGCSPGGVARNVAENLARLGHRVRLVALFGDDPFGTLLREATAAAGVDLALAPVVAGASTCSYLSLHGAGGDMATAVNDMALMDRLDPAWLAAQAAPGAPLAQALDRADAWVLDCNLRADALAWLLQRGRRGLRCVDAVSAHKAVRAGPLLAHVDLLKLNGFEAEALLGEPVRDEAAACAAALALVARGARQVVLSLGARGAAWAERGAPAPSGFAPAPPVDAAALRSTSGAGDALRAGLTHGRLAGGPLAAALRFAQGCAALTLQAYGANHPGMSVAAVQALRGTAPAQSAA
jgi:pseudouridine kinase